MKNSAKGLLVAAAAAGLFGTAVAKGLAADAPKASSDVHCMGVNECKGKGSCHSTDNECKGKNACKGKGVTMISAEECAKKGGTNMDAKK